MYYTYVLKSLKDHKLYVGHTNNLIKRFREHNQGLVESTKNRKPFKLLYYEGCNILEDAIKTRKIFKNWLWKSIFKKKAK